ncbi:MAG: diguanylate cyclase [Syntrophaceae bacterium]|nr:diguanylate cyclase [Syntrophaceae bacterium]
MEKFADYILREQIHETRSSIIYRGHKENESQPFIIKLLKTMYPTPAEIARFKQEYELVKNLDVENIIKIFDLIEHDDKYALVEEDFGGISLRDILTKKKLELKSFLEISSKVSETLGLIHKNNIIHLDIKPDNILINQEENKVKISDFGISAVLTHANDELYNPDVIQGTLSYMSPEQTGRMNRGVDYRTDMYSLGATFYEMLTGEVPFKSDDPMELIHSHIAREPSPPTTLNSSIPPVISSIIMKLLAKNTEERYQNCLGLAYDINECLNQLNQKGHIDEFPIASKDISIRFNIPWRIVGRENEVSILMDSFERVAKGASEMMLVTGQPGIGKSALVNEIHKSIVAKNGYFIAGKYDQFRKDVPYSSIIQSFQGLIRQILTESEERIETWRNRLLSALGNNGKIITDVMPELELIILQQPDVTQLDPEEAQNRFNMVFQNFVNVFTTESHPLVIFLDDLQWADQASLNLLRNIICQETKYLFFIGAYRDNEVTASHPLMLTIDEITKKGKTIENINVGPLDINGINAIIMNVLLCEPEESMPLAQLINKKTAGNPFFVIQFLKSLYDSRFIEIDPQTGWRWDMDKINQMQVTDNVVDFMAGKISTFSQKTQDILKICACIGNRFELEMLSIVSGKSIEETLSDLTSAIQEDMVSLHGNIYKFHHDRIQEAAYSLIPENERAQMHYQIGSNVLKKTDQRELIEKIFYIVDQFNKGIGLVREKDEKIKLAQLNLQAAQKAKKSTAYASSVSYLKTGIGLLPDDSWKSQYELTYLLHKELMECEYLSLNLSGAKKIFELLVKNVNSNIDRANVHTLMIILYTTQGDYAPALKVGLEGMRMVGFNLPENPSDIRLGWELLKLRLRFGRRKIEDLIDMQYVPEPKNLEEMEKLASEYRKLHPSNSNYSALELWEKLSYAYLAIHTATVAYYYNPNLFAYIVINGILWLVDLEVVFEYSPYAYIAMGSIVGSSLGFYEHGYRFGVTALKTNEKIADKKNRCRVEFLFPMFIQHWKKHAKYDLDFYRNAYKSGIETGDLIFSGHNINLIGMTRLMLGDNIDNVLEEYGKYKDFQLGGKDPFVARNYRENTQMCLCLKGLTEAWGSLNSDNFNEEEQTNYYIKENNMLGQFYFSLVKLRINYLFGKLDKCRKIVPDIRRLAGKKVALGNIHIPEFNLFYSLVLTASYPDANFFKKILYKNRLQLNQMKMFMWAKSCPENFQHKYDLVAAEIAANKGSYRKAQILYHKAIEGAHKNGYSHIEAIACERLAKFYLKYSDTEEARLFLQRASRCYVSWGASAKVEELREKYADLFHVDTTLKVTETLSETGTTTTKAFSKTLDLSTVMKVSQVISSEIVLDNLLQKIMHMSLYNAGAQRGHLILESDDKLTIEASEDLDNNEVQVMQSIPLKESTDLCQAIVNYVQRSKEDVILGNASQEGPFTDDPYIKEKGCKSILCTPFMNKGVLTGILYMENDLSVDAFTPERLEILRTISTQAAISIENARLFELATTDGLTKLYVHRYFQLLLDKEMQRSSRHHKHFALIMMDIDNFKSFNDTYGHQLGDTVLRNVARTIKNTVRTDDVAARYGGEEFIVILPETNTQQALIAAEKIRANVAAIEIPHESKKLRVTISLGVSTFPEHAGDIFESKEALIQASDTALYASKHRGKNCVSLFEKKDTGEL